MHRLIKRAGWGDAFEDAEGFEDDDDDAEWGAGGAQGSGQWGSGQWGRWGSGLRTRFRP